MRGAREAALTTQLEEERRQREEAEAAQEAREAALRTQLEEHHS